MATGDQDSQGRAPGSGTIDGTIKGAAGGATRPKDRVDTSVKRLNEGLRTHDAARAQKSRPSTPPYDGPPKAVAGSTAASSPRPSQAAAPNEELDYVSAQVKAAESEVEAARARAEAARLQLDSVKGRNELLQEQLGAARAQVEAAQAQARAAEAQHEAATVQAEAAIAQAEVCREQHESLKTELLVQRSQAAACEEQSQALKEQVGLMRSQADTLEEQLAVMRRQARGTSWLAALAFVGALSMAALAGVAIYGFVQLSGGAPFARALAPAGPAAEAAAPEAAVPRAATPAEDDLAGQLEPLQSGQQRTTEAVAALSTRLDRVAARLADGGGVVATTDRVSLASPPLEGAAEGLVWSADALQQWLAKAAVGPQPGEPRSRYDLAGAVRRPFKRPARVTVDVFEDQWWPAGSALEVAASGSFSGSIHVDPAAPPSKIKVTLWEQGEPATRVYEIAATAAAP